MSVEQFKKSFGTILLNIYLFKYATKSKTNCKKKQKKTTEIT